jgi:hypothetical protein
MRTKLNILFVAALAAIGPGFTVLSSAGAQQPLQEFHDSYELIPVLVYDHVHSDPDGIWAAGDFDPKLGGMIYVAKLDTPKGQWILSENTGASCGLNSVCGFKLMLREPNGELVGKVGGQALVGATAFLTRDFKTLITDDNGPVQHPIQ